ncbi:MAG TPA: DPP IV N-terminal domain-containing protein [Vicinamibacterales bacterium]|nr:DPP IV N-terminal domain-containing protein [Vicinamibacterales bacterium]
MNQPPSVLVVRTALAITAVAGFLQISSSAQDRLRTMPGYERFQQVSAESRDAVRSGALNGAWIDARTFEYARDGKLYRFDLATRRTAEAGAAPEPAGRGRGRGGQGQPERGRQFESADSPDKKFRAVYRDRNLYVIDVASGTEKAVTSDGSVKDRIKNGTASWVYGEELAQRTAMWWSPDSRRLAYYRFDESKVPDYYLQLDQTKIQSRIDVEAYPKAGVDNPVVDLFVYDLASGRSTRVDVRSGKPFVNDAVGHYVYRVAWSPDGGELLFNRTNRRQNVMEFAAANPETGATRVIVREEWPTGWVENSPAVTWLKDGRRFIWESERNGWNNFYLYDLSGRLLNPITAHTSFEAASLIKVDEAAGVIFYTARDGDNHLKLQLHRVGLDGKGDVRLTDPAFHHTIGSCMVAPGALPAISLPGGAGCAISPDNRHVVDIYQTHNTPPATRILDAGSGRVVAELAQSDLTKFQALGLKKVEMFTFTAADGTTTLRGLIHFPSDFDPAKKYPALLAVYGGPASASNTARETFVTPSALTEYGFLVLNIDSRAAPGMGKRTLDSIYLKLGQTEIDDMAAGVRALSSRPYVDRARVGVYGTSYGGYAAAMLLLRYPDLFAAASASAAVTSWRHYDTIYTERYMWIPQENEAGYDLGSAMPYAKDLKGRLLIYYGTADNNVHPSNSMQLIQALQQAGKSFEVQVGPDLGHTGVNQQRMMEFFIESLVLRAGTAASSTY